MLYWGIHHEKLMHRDLGNLVRLSCTQQGSDHQSYSGGFMFGVWSIGSWETFSGQAAWATRFEMPAWLRRTAIRGHLIDRELGNLLRPSYASSGSDLHLPTWPCFLRGRHFDRAVISWGSDLPAGDVGLWDQPGIVGSAYQKLSDISPTKLGKQQGSDSPIEAVVVRE